MSAYASRTGRLNLFMQGNRSAVDALLREVNAQAARDPRPRAEIGTLSTTFLLSIRNDSSFGRSG